LEEELENPMNIHRWRKLEVSHWIIFGICKSWIWRLFSKGNK
jgi:predicted DNA-binding transcriptional regulator AlpA